MYVLDKHLRRAKRKEQKTKNRGQPFFRFYIFRCLRRCTVYILRSACAPEKEKESHDSAMVQHAHHRAVHCRHSDSSTYTLSTYSSIPHLYRPLPALCRPRGTQSRIRRRTARSVRGLQSPSTPPRSSSFRSGQRSRGWR